MPLLGGGLEGVEVAESASDDLVRLEGVELGVTSDGRLRLLPDDFDAGDGLAAEEAARLAAAASILARLEPFLAGVRGLTGALGWGSGRWIQMRLSSKSQYALS